LKDGALGRDLHPVIAKMALPMCAALHQQCKLPLFLRGPFQWSLPFGAVLPPKDFPPLFVVQENCKRGHEG